MSAVGCDGEEAYFPLRRLPDGAGGVVKLDDAPAFGFSAAAFFGFLASRFDRC